MATVPYDAPVIPTKKTFSVDRISGTKAEFNDAVTDGDILFVGDVSGGPITLTGAVTGTGTSTIATTLEANGVGLANLAQTPTARFLGRVTAGTGNVEALTAAEVTAALDAFTSGAKGLAPASGGGTANFLRADGTWAAAGGGSPVTVQDEGSNITTALTTLNFVGAGVTVTGGATAVVTIPGGSSGLGGTGVLSLSTARYEHEATITATGVTAISRVQVWLAAGTDADENTADTLDLVTLAGTPGTDLITVSASFSAPTSGPINILWSAA